MNREQAAKAAKTSFQFVGRQVGNETKQEQSMRVFIERETPAPFPELASLADLWRTKHNLPSPKLPWQHIFVPWERTASTAEMFQDAVSNRRNLFVQEAYYELAKQAEAQLNLMMTLGLHVDFVNEAEPYNSAQDQRDDVVENSHLSIATIACWPDSYHPILSNERGGSYDIFRAVHDLFGHVAIGTGFDRHGEFSAWIHHSSMFHGPAQHAATTELHGENSVLAATGHVAQHKAALLPTSRVFNHAPLWGVR